MTTLRITPWGERLNWLVLALLLLASVAGVFLGAVVTIYYDLTPDMGSLEDDLSAIPLLLYALAVLVGFAHLPLALWEMKHRLWQQASIRLFAAIGPLVIFLGAEGLLAHFLWWDAISETDRFHLLHHALFAGVPLFASYWLLLRWWWRPASFVPTPPISRKLWLVSSVVVLLFLMVPGIFMGIVAPLFFFVSAVVATVAMVVGWRRI